MPNSVNQLKQTLEEIRRTRFGDVPAGLVAAAVEIQMKYPSVADRDVAQRRLEDLVDESLRGTEGAP